MDLVKVFENEMLTATELPQFKSGDTILFTIKLKKEIKNVFSCSVE